MATKTNGGVPLGDPVDAAAVRGELAKLLVSESFRHSGQLKCFLHYSVEETLAGRGDGLKEYSIGVQVLRRGDDFDPRIDPIVRVQARKLRAKLEEYYSGEGAASRVIIHFGKGSYVPSFSEVPEISPDELSPPACVAAAGPVDAGESVPPAALTPSSRRWRILAIAAAAIAVGEAAVYWAHPRSTPETRDSVSVAFAPFANTSGDPGAAAVAARVSSGILASLGRSGAMRPIPISAAAGGVPTEICTKLKTGRLLRGSVRAEGSRLTVKAELFRSSGQIRLWTSTYERDAARDSGGWDRIAAEIAATAERKILDTP